MNHTEHFQTRVALILCCSTLLSSGCGRRPLAGGQAQDRRSAEVAEAAGALTSQALLGHIRVLASDQFEGRSPGTTGENLAVEYLTQQFKKTGLSSGSPDGDFTQTVPVFGYVPQPSATFSTASRTLPLKYPNDYVAWSPRFVTNTHIEASDVVFVGYGVVAPEYAWDDYKDVDVSGKTILMLYGDPPVADPRDPTQLDDKTFKGRELTYYGMWDYKYEIAARKRAAAMIIVHETSVSGFPWEAVASAYMSEQVALNTAEQNARHVPVESWMTLDSAKQVLGLSGHSLEDLQRQALSRSFRPISVGTTVAFGIKQTVREFSTHNVAALIPGSDPALRNEYVVYTAHWDHLGRNPKLTSDQIYNGALDNASGTAGLLELASAFRHLPVSTKRSVLFLATTAEERGLLGARYYTDHPLYPLKKTLVDINIDELNVWGRTSDVTMLGRGHSTLDKLVDGLAADQKRLVKSDTEPENGNFYRSDNFAFARMGVATVYFLPGKDYTGKSLDFGKQRWAEYNDHDYHQVSDEVKADWDLSGAVEDLRLLFFIGCAIADGDHFPEWNIGSEFKPK